MGGNVWVYDTDDEIMANEKPFYAYIYIYIYIICIYIIYIVYIIYIIYREKDRDRDTYIERYMYFAYFYTRSIYRLYGLYI